MQQALDDVRWTERGVPPQVADQVPWRRLFEMDRVFTMREQVQRAVAERQEQEADREQLAQEHAKKMAAQGLTPGGQPLNAGG